MDISPTSLQQLIVDEVLITRCRTVAFRNCVIIGAFMSVERLQTLARDALVPAISILGSTERKKAGNDDLVGVESTQPSGEERASFVPFPPPSLPHRVFKFPF